MYSHDPGPRQRPAHAFHAVVASYPGLPRKEPGNEASALQYSKCVSAIVAVSAFEGAKCEVRLHFSEPRPHCYSMWLYENGNQHTKLLFVQLGD